MKTFDVIFKWTDNGEIRLDMSEWMSNNIKHPYRNHHKFCDVYCFDDELDAMAFKLRWS